MKKNQRRVWLRQRNFDGAFYAKDGGYTKLLRNARIFRTRAAADPKWRTLVYKCTAVRATATITMGWS